MAELHNVAFEKKCHLDPEGFTLQPNTYGAVMSLDNQTKVQLQMDVNQGYSKRNAKLTTVLGALQVLAGFLAIAFQTAATVIENTSESRPILQFLGCGIWCGTVFLITGILGIRAGRKQEKNVIMPLLVFSIIASVIVWTLVALAALNFAGVESCPSRSITLSFDGFYYQDYDNDGIKATRLISATKSITDEVTDWSLCTGVTGKVLKAMDVMLIITAIFEFAIAVTTASICCRTRPCCRPSVPVLFIQQAFVVPGDNYLRESSMQSNNLAPGTFVRDQGLPKSAKETRSTIDANFQPTSAYEA